MMIQHYWELSRYYARLILTVVTGTTLAAVVGSVVLLVASPTYTATASLTVKPTEAELLFARNFLRSTSFDPAGVLVQTHKEYLLSRPVAAAALARITGDATRLAAAPGTNGTTNGTANGGAHELLDLVGTEFQTFRRDLRRLINLLNYGEHIDPDAYDAAVDDLIESVEINMVEGSYILQVAVDNGEPLLAAELANGLAGAYVERLQQEVGSGARAVAANLEGEIASREAALDELYQRERALRHQLGVLSLAEERRALLDAQETERAKLQDDLVALAELEARLTAIDAGKDELRRRGLLRQVEEELGLSEARRSALGERIKVRRATLTDITTRLAALTEEDKVLFNLDQRRQQLLIEIADLRNQLVNVELSRSSTIDQLRVIDPARVPLYPSSPKILTNSIGGLIGGLLLAGFVVIALDTGSNTIKTAADLHRLAGERSLGRLSGAAERAAANGLRRAGLARHRAFRRAATAITWRLATLGRLKTVPIRVTGLGSPATVDRAATGVAAALALGGRIVRLRGVELGKRRVWVGNGQVIDAGEVDEREVCEVEAIGPISAQREMREIAQSGAPLICALRPGEVTEGMFEEFQAEAQRQGTCGVFFIMVGR